MSDLVIWELELGIVMVLVAYLYHKSEKRLLHRQGRFDPSEWTGKGIDVSDLKPKLEAVRRNYLAARSPRRGLCFHRTLLQWARQTVVRLDYFRAKKPEPQARPPLS